MKKISNSELETKKIAQDFAKNLKSGDIICLDGDLGTGKTHFVKFIGEFFNIKQINSPTFILMKIYKIKNNKIKQLIHFDLYRIKNLKETQDFSLKEYLQEKDSIIFIEWSKIIKKILPKKTKFIKIKYLNQNKREIKIKC